MTQSPHWTCPSTSHSPIYCLHTCPVIFRTKCLRLGENLKLWPKVLERRAKQGTELTHAISSEKQNPTAEFCLQTSSLPRDSKGLFSIFLPLSSFRGSPNVLHKPDSALAGGHGVSNFERGLLQNVQFQTLVRLPSSCPNFLGE
jgi:hypothetical protein